MRKWWSIGSMETPVANHGCTGVVEAFPSATQRCRSRGCRDSLLGGTRESKRHSGAQCHTSMPAMRIGRMLQNRTTSRDRDAIRIRTGAAAQTPRPRDPVNCVLSKVRPSWHAGCNSLLRCMECPAMARLVIPTLSVPGSPGTLIFCTAPATRADASRRTTTGCRAGHSP